MKKKKKTRLFFRPNSIQLNLKNSLSLKKKKRQFFHPRKLVFLAHAVYQSISHLDQTTRERLNEAVRLIQERSQPPIRDCFERVPLGLTVERDFYLTDAAALLFRRGKRRKGKGRKKKKK